MPAVSSCRLRLRVRALGLLSRTNRPDWLLLRAQRDTSWRLPGRDVVGNDTPSATALTAVQDSVGLIPNGRLQLRAHTWTSDTSNGDWMLTYLFDFGVVTNVPASNPATAVNWVHRLLVPAQLDRDDAVPVLELLSGQSAGLVAYHEDAE